MAGKILSLMLLLLFAVPTFAQSQDELNEQYWAACHSQNPPANCASLNPNLQHQTQLVVPKVQPAPVPSFPQLKDGICCGTVSEPQPRPSVAPTPAPTPTIKPYVPQYQPSGAPGPANGDHINMVTPNPPNYAPAAALAGGLIGLGIRHAREKHKEKKEQEAENNKRRDQIDAENNRNDAFCHAYPLDNVNGSTKCSDWIKSRGAR
jgi:hypothetical protein